MHKFVVIRKLSRGLWQAQVFTPDTLDPDKWFVCATKHATSERPLRDWCATVHTGFPIIKIAPEVSDPA